MAQLNMKEEWRYALIKLGEPLHTFLDHIMKLKLFVISWDILHQVSTCMYIVHVHAYVHKLLHVLPVIVHHCIYKLSVQEIIIS